MGGSRPHPNLYAGAHDALRVQDRRGFVHRQFVREGWRADQAVLIFVLGTKTGERLESDIDTSSVRRLDGARYIFTPCRDMGDEWDNPNGTSATTCKVYEAYKVSAAWLYGWHAVG